MISRSQIMARIKGKNTKPELALRKLVYSMGYRYRLHGKGLPGRPDMVFKGKKKAIFIHGCFWHCHTCKRGRRKPASNVDYWIPKLERNKKRDACAQRELISMGWKVLVVWECELGDLNRIATRLKNFIAKEGKEKETGTFFIKTP